MQDHKRRQDDPQTAWDWIVLIIKQLMVLLGLFRIAFVIGMGAGILAFEYSRTAKQAEPTEVDCGSCKKGGAK